MNSDKQAEKAKHSLSTSHPDLNDWKQVKRKGCLSG